MIVSGELEQRRTLLPQTIEIDNFIVGGAGLPALPDDPNPFEGQGADGGVVVFAFGALAVVVSAGPALVSCISFGRRKARKTKPKRPNVSTAPSIFSIKLLNLSRLMTASISIGRCLYSSSETIRPRGRKSARRKS